MLNKPGGYRAVVLGFIALAIVASMVGAQAGGQGANGSLRIASIDRTRLITEYKYTVETDAMMQKKQADAELTLRIWAQNAQLIDTDQKRLSDLTLEQKAAGANFDGAKKNELDQLTKKSADYGKEFTDLQTNQNPNPAQTARLNLLTRYTSDTQSRMDVMRKAVTAELQKQDQESQVKIIKDMRDAVSQVAKAKGYNLVLPNDIALFSDNDLTDAVLKSMNEKK